MKKVILFVAAFLMIGLANVQAQGVAPAPKAPQTQNATHVTKTGAPDRRFKENKQTEVAPKHVRKDGQADMRFKENKEAAAAKAAASAKATREARAKSKGRIR
ncbi:MAG: hypothetical protein JST36_09365 [Bacteroidetes bacterium]|nr:hypothetical protein [Bacteroidota bacterium]